MSSGLVATFTSFMGPRQREQTVTSTANTHRSSHAQGWHPRPLQQRLVPQLLLGAILLGVGPDSPTRNAKYVGVLCLEKGPTLGLGDRWDAHRQMHDLLNVLGSADRGSPPLAPAPGLLIGDGGEQIVSIPM